MRVLVLSSLWPPSLLGGAETYAARLGDALRRRGHEVGAVTLGVEGDDVVEHASPWPYRLDAYVDQPSWKRAAFHARDLYDPTSAAVVRRAIKAFRPDVVHSHSIAGLSTAALTSPSAMGVAHVHHLHDYWLLCQRSSFTRRDGSSCDQRCIGCVTFRRARSALLQRHGPDALIAVSNYVARAHQALPWTHGLVDVIHLPTDDVDPPERLEATSGTLTFGYIGQLTFEKGVRTLLRVFAGVADTGARLLVAGRGPLRDEVAGKGVTALGWLDAAGRDQFWRSIDALVVPSEWAEPAALVAVEARARELPVIAANTGGLVEVVEERSRPLIFQPGDRRGLADSIRRFAADPGAFKPAPTSTWPTWSEHVAAVERVYDKAISRRG